MAAHNGASRDRIGRTGSTILAAPDPASMSRDGDTPATPANTYNVMMKDNDISLTKRKQSFVGDVILGGKSAKHLPKPVIKTRAGFGL